MLVPGGGDVNFPCTFATKFLELLAFWETDFCPFLDPGHQLGLSPKQGSAHGHRSGGSKLVDPSRVGRRSAVPNQVCGSGRACDQAVRGPAMPTSDALYLPLHRQLEVGVSTAGTMPSLVELDDRTSNARSAGRGLAGPSANQDWRGRCRACFSAVMKM